MIAFSPLMLIGTMVTASIVQMGPAFSLPLAVGQTIEKADSELIGLGWKPNPEATPMIEERQRSGVNLKSLSSCSGTGIGFCRFDYRKGEENLSIVTVPEHHDEQTTSIVERWWQ